MRYLLKSSLSLVLFMFSTLLFGQNESSIPNNYLVNAKSNLVYDMSLTYKDYYGSGLFVAKRIAPASYHGVFLSKVGLKLMEFTIKNGEFKWIKLLEYFDRRPLKKVLERDFSMLMLSDTEMYKKAKSLGKKSEEECYKIKGSRKIKLTVEQGEIIAIENRKFLNLNKTKISFSKYSENIPKSINLNHQLIKVKFDLELLEQ